MNYLTKQDILVAQDLKFEDVDVPEWGGAVRVKALTGKERDSFEASMIKGEGKDRKTDFSNMRARLCGLCMVDESGARIFDDSEIALLGAKSSAALDRVFGIAQRLNGMSQKDIEDMSKNSSGDQAADSHSD